MLSSVEKMGALLCDIMRAIDIWANDFQPNDVVSFILYNTDLRSLLPLRHLEEAGGSAGDRARHSIGHL
jgi:hypothetical protein